MSLLNSPLLLDTSECILRCSKNGWPSAAWFSGLIGQTRVSYRWPQLEQMDQWWHWTLLAICTLAVVTFVWRLYRRDASELPKPVGWALLLLRIAALTGLLVHFFHLEKRVEQRVVRESRVAVLVDTSLSMSLPADSPLSTGRAQPAQSRIDEARWWIAQSGALDSLARDHQVTVYRFDSANRPVQLAALARSGQIDKAADSPSTENELARLRFARTLARVALGLAVVAGLMILSSLVGQFAGVRNLPALHWSLLSGTSFMLAAMLIAGLAAVPTTAFQLRSLLYDDDSRIDQSDQESAGDAEAETNNQMPDDWGVALQPSGTETRLGDALRFVLEREAGNPLASIVVLSDGRGNAGIAARQASSRAASDGVPIQFIGLGSEKTPPNVQLAEIDVAQRLYPGDRFALRAILSASGYAGRDVVVQVLSGAKGATSALTLEAEQTVTLGSDGDLTTVEFQLPPKSVGSWDYVVQVVPPAGDADQTDDQQRQTVEVVERKNRVLIFAGGPTREYQFVRNLLYRDRDVESHVLLQTGSPGSSQESQELLDSFPADRAALSQYDAILAFDPDWTVVPESSVKAVEQWVAEQAGGLLMVAGSVEMPKWISRSASGARSQYLRGLSPVVLQQRGSSLLVAGRVEAAQAWPLRLTADGQQTDFLWLAEDPKVSLRVWEEFEGVYSFYSAYELKPGAKALMHFADPGAVVAGQMPVYMASQFYGAGRVAYMGSGEMWRMRYQGPSYFDRFYIKMLRWLSQGRLLMDSDRGVLLVDRDQAALGEQVAVRAVLKTQQYEPLIQSEVVARLLDPHGRNLPLVLRPMPDGSQPGVYVGQFPLLAPGIYTIQLQMGGLASTELLETSVKAKIPATEMQFAQRNDELIGKLVDDSGGRFWIGAASTIGQAGNTNVEKGVSNKPANSTPSVEANKNVTTADAINTLAEAIPSQDVVAYMPGTPDDVFQFRWLGWLMMWIATCLSLEWLSRRTFRLA